MRKILIGVKGELTPEFNKMVIMDGPTINGNNLFSGDFKGNALMIGEVVSTQAQWEAYWKVLGEKPPGKLPEGALAIFQAAAKSDRAIRLEPKSVNRNGDGITVEWERMNIPNSEMTGARSTYTVLLIPPGMLTASFMDTFPVQRMREVKIELEHAFDQFKNGHDFDIVAPSKAMFKKKYHVNP